MDALQSSYRALWIIRFIRIEDGTRSRDLVRLNEPLLWIFEQVMQMVCSRAGALCRDQLQCDRALRPPGHCCQMCGKIFPELITS